ncbi:hypothetical protein BU16DRAFT_612525 [Lophium mytilinum]|uniref:Uncharacterized protein n=1 Tax=Lophium mytilinum TaxID=390894 RepID=A0A6A6RHL0_9PEZI|nr:hypothetical protein BU16DRAFT_612525 [Lophium mytilinum]
MPTSTAWATVYLPAATITLAPLPGAAGTPPHWTAAPAFSPGFIIFAILSLALIGITITGYTLQNRRKHSNPQPHPSSQLAVTPARDPRDPIPLSPWHQQPQRQPSELARMRQAREPQSVIISLPGARTHDYRRRSEWGSIHHDDDAMSARYHDHLDDDAPGPSNHAAQHPLAAASSVYTDYDRSRRPSSAPSMPSPVRIHAAVADRAARPETEQWRVGGSGQQLRGGYRGSAAAPTGSVMSTWNLGFGSMPRDRASQISMPSAPAESEFDTVFTGDPY